MRQTRAFTLIELLVVVAVIALLIGLLLPALGSARKAGQQTVNATNLRTMHQGMFIFGQDNDGLYPGVREISMDYDEAVVPNAEIPQAERVSWLRGDSITSRYLLLLNGEYVDASTIVSPVELADIPLAVSGRRVEYNPTVQTGNFDANDEVLDGYDNNDIFWSYALLQITARPNNSGPWRVLPMILPSWRDTSNALVPIASDRVINFGGLANDQFFPFPERHDSLWTGPQDSGGWVGSVVYNDGRTEFIKQTSVIANTKFGGSPVNRRDSLFTFNDGFDYEERSDAVFVAKGPATIVIR